MKTTIPFHALMAAICTAAHSNAQQTSYVRGSVEEQEEKREILAEDPTVQGAGEVNSLLVKDALSNNAPIEEGKGYDKLRGSIQIPACVGRTEQECLAYAELIYLAHEEWFGIKHSSLVSLVADKHLLGADTGYYYVGIPVDQNDYVASAGCMVSYRYDWCALDGTDARCTSIGPWECMDTRTPTGCMHMDNCCNTIKKSYPGVDINGNPLECYSRSLGHSHEELCLMGHVVTMHMDTDGDGGVVAIPASISVAPKDTTNCFYLAYRYLNK